MDWLFLSLSAAFFSATADAVTKKNFSCLSAYEMGTVRYGYTLPWLAISFLFIPVPALDRHYFLSLACGLPLELLAVLCYMEAIKRSPLSLTLPFLAFTPLFLILTGWIVLGETITWSGALGIFLITLGSYCLNLSRTRDSLLGPVRAVVKEPGSMLMMLVALLYSVTSVIGKAGVLHSSPWFFGTTYNIGLSLLMLLTFRFTPGARTGHLVSKPMAGLLLGGVYAAMIFSHFLAISLVQAAYMISIKRMSLLFGVLYGAFLFREQKITERFTGAVIMAVGVLIIGFSGRA
jgi:drug/metabolite transporter (DMT)-like permease